MISRRELVLELVERYGSPLYVFDQAAFVQNYHQLTDAFRRYYENYFIAYSFKTNYTPYIAGLVEQLGGFGEVVSGMEYAIAQKVGFPDDRIVFNGPNKGKAGIDALFNGSMVHVDNLTELEAVCQAAGSRSTENFEIALRVNVDVGQRFISRFGLDPEDLPTAFQMVERTANLRVTGLHCHISRCRGLDAWIKRAKCMLELADQYFEAPPRYIDLGSGMFGAMDPEFAAQFENVPTYKEYAAAVGGLFARHYENFPVKPMLLTEPGTTLINKYVDFIGRVDAIKRVRGKNFAVLDCSAHNLGETCTLKELPMRVVQTGVQRWYEDMDFTGYTCLEQDVMHRHYTGPLAVGDYVVFGNVGGYSNVLKPPFIAPNCAMAALCPDGGTRVIKQRETFADLLGTYAFPEKGKERL